MALINKTLREMTDRQRDTVFRFVVFILGAVPWVLVYLCLTSWL